MIVIFIKMACVCSDIFDAFVGRILFCCCIIFSIILWWKIAAVVLACFVMYSLFQALHSTERRSLLSFQVVLGLEIMNRQLIQRWFYFLVESSRRAHLQQSNDLHYMI